MATVAFPASLANLLERKSPVAVDDGVRDDVRDDGEPLAIIVREEEWTTIRCRFSWLTATEYDTLKTFLRTNRGNTVTWAIDAENYSGRILGGWGYTKDGNRFSVNFTYYAKVV